MAASLGYAPRSRCPTSTCAVAPPSCAPAPLKEAYYLGALMPLFYQPYNGGEGASVPVLLLLATARLVEGLRLGVRFYPPGLTFTAPACLTVCLSLLRTVPQGAKLALRWATSEVQPEYAGGMVLVGAEDGVLYGGALAVPTAFEPLMAACVYEIAAAGPRFMSAIGFGEFSTPAALPREYITVLAEPALTPAAPLARAALDVAVLELPYNYAHAWQALGQNGDFPGSLWVASATALVDDPVAPPAVALVPQTGQWAPVGFRPAATPADEATYAVVVTVDIDPGTEVGVAAGVLLPSGIDGTEVFRWRAGAATLPAGSVLLFSHIRGELPGSDQPRVTVASGSRNPTLDVGSVETFAYPSDAPIASLIAFAGPVDDFRQIVNMAYTIFYTGVFPEGLRGYLLPLHGVCPPTGGVWFGNTRVSVCGPDQWRAQIAVLASARPLPWTFQNLPFFPCDPCGPTCA